MCVGPVRTWIGSMINWRWRRFEIKRSTELFIWDVPFLLKNILLFQDYFDFVHKQQLKKKRNREVLICCVMMMCHACRIPLVLVGANY
jgi:hypothetical protein